MCLWYETEMTQLHICHTFVILCQYASYCFVKGAPLDSNAWASQYVNTFEVWHYEDLPLDSSVLTPKQYETRYWYENCMKHTMKIYETIWLRANIESFARATVSCCTLHIAVAYCIEVNIVWRVKRLQRFQGWIQWHQPCGIQWNL